MQDIYEQTCLYAEQYIATHRPMQRYSRVHQWIRSPFTPHELKKFFSLVIVMGLIHYPRIEDYWLKSWPFCTSNFSSVMSRDRFSLILRFLHLNDNSGYVPKGQVGYDPLYKLRPFLTKLLERFEANYTPRKELSLDEQMISFKGRLSFVQYMPKKPTKWGIKAFVLADSKSGYTFRWRLYTGKTKHTHTEYIMHLQNSCPSTINYNHLYL